jgi:predicted transcriptional regulator
MSMKTITFEAPEESIAILDEIAVDLEVDRSTVLREAIAMYLEDYEELKAQATEADRQFEAGETISHEEVVAKYKTWRASNKVRQAA